jgi:hypothetical protein
MMHWVVLAAKVLLTFGSATRLVRAMLADKDTSVTSVSSWAVVAGVAAAVVYLGIWAVAP